MGNPDWENVDNKKTDSLSKHTIKASTSSKSSQWGQCRSAILVSFWRNEHTKSLYWSPRFCRNNHPHGWWWYGREDREKYRVHVHNNKYNNKHEAYVVNKKQQEWKQTWQSPEEFKHRLSVYYGVVNNRWTKMVCRRNSVVHIRSDWQDNTQYERTKPIVYCQDLDFCVSLTTSLPVTALKLQWVLWEK